MDERVTDPKVSRCIDWFAEGESKAVEVAGVRVVVRYVSRKGRRSRICISAPAGAVFCAVEAAMQDDKGDPRSET